MYLLYILSSLTNFTTKYYLFLYVGMFRNMYDTLDKEMAIHSSILAWRIPRTEEPAGLQRVGHDWSNLAHTHACVYTYILCSRISSSKALNKSHLVHVLLSISAKDDFFYLVVIQVNFLVLIKTDVFNCNITQLKY